MVLIVFRATLCVLFLVLTVEGQLGHNNVFNTTRASAKENAGLSQLPFLDSVGNVAAFLDVFLSQVTRDMPTPKSSTCSAQIVQFGATNITISLQPYGYCSYCCPIKNRAKYIRLYFTSIATGEKTVELRMKKKRGMLRSAGLNSAMPTIIYIHGFTEYGKGASPRAMRDAYLSLDQGHNIIVVDWGEFTVFPWYQQAVEHTKIIAVALTKFVRFYNGTGELPISNLHLIGFSLGAHMAGFVGKSFQGPEKIPRITALDPAVPLFPLNDSTQVIAKTDAEYVDVIHTNPGTFGFPISLGHADFYPNGRNLLQPGCNVGNLVDEQRAEEYVWCSHLRAWNLYVESVRTPKAFPATKCGVMKGGSIKECRFITEAYMGFPASKETTLGDFFLTTNERKPFGKSAEEQEADMKEVNLII